MWKRLIMIRIYLIRIITIILQLIILCSPFTLSNPHSLNVTSYIFSLTTCGQCRTITPLTKGSHCGDDRVQSGNRLSHN